MKSKKARNILSLSIFFVAICAVVVNVVIVAKNIRYNQELTQEKERIEKDLGNSDDDVYDIYIVDNYTVYDEKVIFYIVMFVFCIDWCGVYYAGNKKS